MFQVYVLRGQNGRHYIGQTGDLMLRHSQHRRGHTHTTRRLGGELELVASAEVENRVEARALEMKLKVLKNPAKAIEFLRRKGCS